MEKVTAISLDVNDTLKHLKKIALLSFTFQFAAAIIYMLSSMFFPKSNDLTVVCGLIAILISLLPVIYAIGHKRFFLIFSCLSVFNISPIWFLYLEAILPGYDAYEFTQPVYRMEALFWISMFQVFVNLFYVLIWRKGTSYSINTFSYLKTLKLSPNFYARLAIFAFVIPLAAFFFFYGSLDILLKATLAGRSGGGSAGGLRIWEHSDDGTQVSGGVGSLMLPFNWLWQLTPLFGSISFVTSPKKWRFFPIFSLLLGFLVIFVFFLGGTRGAMMFVAAPVSFFLFYYNWNRGVKFWLTAVALLFLLIGVMEFQKRFRGNLLEVIADPAKAARAADLESATTFDPSKAHRDNNMYLFCLLIKGYPEKYSFVGFKEFFTIIVNPIPRVLWPGKPVIFGAQDINKQQPFISDGPLLMGTTSLSYSVVGDAYQAAGLFGIVVFSVIYALFLVYFDGVIFYTKNNPGLSVSILGLSVFLSFWGYRAFFGFVSFIYPLVLLIIIIRFIKFYKRV